MSGAMNDQPDDLCPTCNHGRIYHDGNVPGCVECGCPDLFGDGKWIALPQDNAPEGQPTSVEQTGFPTLCAILLDAWYGRHGTTDGYAELKDAPYGQRHLDNMAETMRRLVGPWLKHAQSAAKDGDNR